MQQNFDEKFEENPLSRPRHIRDNIKMDLKIK